MSTKSTIFLTRDNEHCYEECLEWDDQTNSYAIYLELDKRNVELSEDSENYFIRIKGGSHLHQIITQLKNVDEDNL